MAKELWQICYPPKQRLLFVSGNDSLWQEMPLELPLNYLTAVKNKGFFEPS